jgi:hypothetical protein
VLTYGSECWSLRRHDESTLQTCERREMRRVYRPIKVYDVWRYRFNYELYYVYNELEVVKMMTAGRIR